MNRQQAIEAGARAAFIREAGESNADLATRTWDNYPAEHHVKRYWRNIIAAVIDAAAPHLMGEPVGYAIVYDYGHGPWLQDARISTSVEAARGRRGYLYPYSICALVAVEDVAASSVEDQP